MCKKLEGAVLPVLVKAAEDRIENPSDSLDVGEDNPGPGAPANRFTELASRLAGPHPAALVLGALVNGLKRRQAPAAIGDDELETAPPQTACVKILQELFPGYLSRRWAWKKPLSRLTL